MIGLFFFAGLTPIMGLFKYRLRDRGLLKYRLRDRPCLAVTVTGRFLGRVFAFEGLLRYSLLLAVVCWTGEEESLLI